MCDDGKTYLCMVSVSANKGALNTFKTQSVCQVCFSSSFPG